MSGLTLENGCTGDMVSQKLQNLELDLRAAKTSLNETERLELEELILDMTAAGSGITTAEINQLYKDTSDELRRLLVRKLGDEEAADSLAQDAYLK